MKVQFQQEKKKQESKAKRRYDEYSTARANKKIKEGKDKVKFVTDNIREEEERNIKRYGKEFIRRQREARQRLKDSSKKGDENEMERSIESQLWHT